MKSLGNRPALPRHRTRSFDPKVQEQFPAKGPAGKEEQRRRHEAAAAIRAFVSELIGQEAAERLLQHEAGTYSLREEALVVGKPYFALRREYLRLKHMVRIGYVADLAHRILESGATTALVDVDKCLPLPSQPFAISGDDCLRSQTLPTMRQIFRHALDAKWFAQDCKQARLGGIAFQGCRAFIVGRCVPRTSHEAYRVPDRQNDVDPSNEGHQAA